eukprot:5059657-Amphidinium_carterae.1
MATAIVHTCLELPATHHPAEHEKTRVGTQVHITNEQATVLLACGEYWQHGLIPKDVFLDMLVGLLGPRGKLDRLSREEQLAVSCSLDEAEMVDVRRFVASLDLQPTHEAGIQAMMEEEEGEHPLDASGPQRGSMQSHLKA